MCVHLTQSQQQLHHETPHCQLSAEYTRAEIKAVPAASRPDTRSSGGKHTIRSSQHWQNGLGVQSESWGILTKCNFAHPQNWRERACTDKNSWKGTETVQAYLALHLTSLSDGSSLHYHSQSTRFYYPHPLTRGAGHTHRHLRISVSRKTLGLEETTQKGREGHCVN